MGDDLATLETVDCYLDAAPRPDADVVEVGAFTLFVSRTPWAYYARPARGRDAQPQAPDLVELAQECLRRGVGLELEWVHDLHPGLGDLARGHGLEVHEYALMVADASAFSAPEAPADRLFVVEPGRDDAAAVSAAMLAHLVDRAQRGLSVTAVAIDADGPVASGSYQPIGAMAEIVGMATLPSARRRGLAAALTGVLACHAHAHGVQQLLLSAQSEDVARVYERAGFTRIGTAMAAEPPGA